MLTVDDSEETIAAIARNVARGQCILFLGAGANAPPPADSPYQYADSERPPFGGEFAEQLAAKCGYEKAFPGARATDLARVSLYYELKYGRKDLVEQIQNAMHLGKQPSPALRGLAKLPFSLVGTTNYDQLFERALAHAGKDPFISTYQDEQEPTVDCPYDPSPDRPFMVKIHGDVKQPSSIVITDEDYIQFILRMNSADQFHPVPMTFKYYFKKWPTLFVGYSLLDYNLRLLFRTLRWKLDKAVIPDTYSVDQFPDLLIFEVWHNERRYVKFIAQNVWLFAPKLYKMVTGEDMPQ